MLNKKIKDIISNFSESERLNKQKSPQFKLKTNKMRLRKIPNNAKNEKLDDNIIKKKLSKSCNKANGQLLKDLLYEEKLNSKNLVRGLYTIKTVELNSLTEKSNSKIISLEAASKQDSKDKNKSKNHFYKKAISKKINRYKTNRQNECLLSYLLFNKKNSRNKNSNSISNSISKTINKILKNKIIKKPRGELNNKIKIKNNKIIWRRNKNLASYNIHNKNLDHFFSANDSKLKIENKSNEFPTFKSLGEKYERHSEEKQNINNTNFNLTDDISKNMTKSINKYYEDSVKYNDFFNYDNHSAINEKTENNVEEKKNKSKNKNRKNLKILLSNEFQRYFTINKSNFFNKKNVNKNKSRNNDNFSLVKKKKNISNNIPLNYITNSNFKDKLRWNYTAICSLNAAMIKCRSSNKNKSIRKKDIYKIAMLKKKHDNMNKNKNAATNNSFLTVEKTKAKLPILKQKILNVNIKLSKPKSIKKNKKNT